VNILYEANVPSSIISKIMSTLHEDDKETFLPKTIFNITEKSKSLLNIANGILQSMTEAEKVIQILTT
jgi:predicted transcriptional regulator